MVFDYSGSFRRIFIPMVFSSMINQLATGFVARPLEMISDLQFNSLFIVQMIGYLISLFSSFVFGVVYASLHVPKPSLHSSWSWLNINAPLTCFLCIFYRVRPLISAEYILDRFRQTGRVSFPKIYFHRSANDVCCWHCCSEPADSWE